MKSWLRILIAMGIGFAAGMLVMTVVIYFGYTHAYASGGNAYDLRILGLRIYELTRVGSKYSGTSVGVNMGAFCGICMAGAAALEELIHWKRKFKGNEEPNAK